MNKSFVLIHPSSFILSGKDSLMSWLLNALYLLLLAVLSPWLAYRAWRTGRYRPGLRQKLLGLSEKLPAGAVWFHGVSVGEVHLLRQVVAAWRRRMPDVLCVISTTTDTGFAEAMRAFPDLPVFFFPLDFSWAVRRTLRQVEPALVVLAEAELWPNFLLACRRQGVPVAVINGRMSPRSLHRYQTVGFLSRRLFGLIDLLLMQTEEYAQALCQLGVAADRVRVTGSAKFDGSSGDRDQPRTAELRRLLQVQPGQLVWIAGSTQAPEEEIVLAIYARLRPSHPGLRLILVPRQKDRFEEVAHLVERSGLPWGRRSRSERLEADVVLVDTIGELGALWGLADVAFVGGSMDGRRGGQNMIEPAAYGAAVLFGPHVWNFKDTVRRLLEAKAACQVEDAAALETAVRRLLADPVERQRLGTSARQLVRSQQGTTERTVTMLAELLAHQVTLRHGRLQSEPAA
jgi:3-deoxy-D-manno-octulosonic-acid transferase